MCDERTIEAIEFECAEEGRTARLLVEVRHELGARTLVGIQCDNPKLSSLDNWDCCWSCWDRVAERFPDLQRAPSEDG
jgi:hypothetical protein